MTFNLQTSVNNQAPDSLSPAVSRVTIKREDILNPLQMVVGIIERKHALPVLANIWVAIANGVLTMIATDTEMELQAMQQLASSTSNFAPVTVPALKLLDICRSLPETSELEIVAENNARIVVNAGKSRFILAGLPADDYPLMPRVKSETEFSIPAKILKSVANKIYFAIPQQNFRTYLSGMFLEIKDGMVRAIASDSVRLAISMAPFADAAFAVRAIIPRRAVAEMVRFLPEEDDAIAVGISGNYLRIAGKNFVFTSKLIAGRFPRYGNIASKKDANKIDIGRHELKQALTRLNILSHEILRSFNLVLSESSLKLRSNNPEHEEACEELEINYSGAKLNMIFNINYLLDVINSITDERLVIALQDEESGAIIESKDEDIRSVYVLMPMCEVR